MFAVFVLLGLLASGKASAWLAALIGLLTACVAAVGVFGMPATLVVGQPTVTSVGSLTAATYVPVGGGGGGTFTSASSMLLSPPAGTVTVSRRLW